MDWWQKTLEDRYREGRGDADHGVFQYPYPDNGDSADDEENVVYKRGFEARRRELGDRFKWNDG